MPHEIYDRVMETSTTTGTGDFTVAGAVSGYRTFGSVLAVGDSTYATIANDTVTTEWEVGLYT
jgi:hypothetical protein